MATETTIALTEEEVEDVLDRWGSHIDKVLRHLTPYGNTNRLHTLTHLPIGGSSAHPIDKVQDEIEMLNETLKETIETYREKGQEILRGEVANMDLEVSNEELNEVLHIRKKAKEHKESWKGNSYWENEWLRRKAYWKERRDGSDTTSP